MIIHLFKAEFSRYLAEVRTYFPDQITSMVVPVLIFVVFTFLNIDAGNSAFYIGYAYWYLISGWGIRQHFGYLKREFDSELRWIPAYILQKSKLVH